MAEQLPGMDDRARWIVEQAARAGLRDVREKAALAILGRFPDPREALADCLYLPWP